MELETQFMATEKQIEANRRNAQHSTGPRTPEGKARSARNALKHGLASLSKHAFLSVEDRRAFDKSLEGYMRTYQPQHLDEVDLLVDAAYCKWRQKRIWNVETTLVEMTIAEQQHHLQRQMPKANVAAHVANAVRANTESDHLNRRYEAQLHRQYVRNLKLLRELQAERLDLEPTLEDLNADLPPPTPIRREDPPPTPSRPPQPDSPNRPP